MNENSVNNSGILNYGGNINAKNLVVGKNNSIINTPSANKSPEDEKAQKTQAEPKNKNEQKTQAEPDSYTPSSPSPDSMRLSVPLQKIEVFFCYSHWDKAARDRLDSHLKPVKMQFSLIDWYDGNILPGGDWKQEIDIHINRAHIILALVSADFIASHFCYEKEMKRALERHNAGEATVIPILLRNCLWEETPLRKLQVLPTGARPISTWPDQDAAFSDVARGIQRVISGLVRAQ